MILPIFYNKMFDCWECDTQTPMSKGFTMPAQAEKIDEYRIIGICGKCFAKYSKTYSDNQRHNK